LEAKVKLERRLPCKHQLTCGHRITGTPSSHGEITG
jgi:hypothetical protein